MLNNINGITHSITLDHQSDYLMEKLYKLLMTDKTTCRITKFDKKDRLDICRFLGIMTKKEYAIKWVELDKQKKLVEKKQEMIVGKKNENVVDNGGSNQQIKLPATANQQAATTKRQTLDATDPAVAGT